MLPELLPSGADVLACSISSVTVAAISPYRHWSHVVLGEIYTQSKIQLHPEDLIASTNKRDKESMANRTLEVGDGGREVK